jgi:hypothetical protein
MIRHWLPSMTYKFEIGVYAEQVIKSTHNAIFQPNLEGYSGDIGVMLNRQIIPFSLLEDNN